jgi:DNA polymerase-3 subunit delta'
LGKATLAYRFARTLLGARSIGPRAFDVSREDPVSRRISASSHPDLFVLRRTAAERSERFRREIVVEDARGLGDFFSLMPAEGGWRVAIVDAVDDLNRNAANAILKTLEEPPPRSVLLLVCHAPGATLATIRSRCRRLALRALNDEMVEKAVQQATGASVDKAVLKLAAGRPGRAIALQVGGGASIAATIDEAMRNTPERAAPALIALAYEKGAPLADRLDLTIDAAQDWLNARAREIANDDKGAAALANAYFELEDVRAQAQELNLDAAHAMTRTAQILSRAAGR